jgi:hypothetical protein
MRSQRTADRQAIDRTLSALVTLLEAGHEEVRIEKVVRMLGRELKVAGPAGGRADPAPDPRADPMTGCLPVTPGPPRS